MKKAIWHGLAVLPVLVIMLFFCSYIGTNQSPFISISDAFTGIATAFENNFTFSITTTFKSILTEYFGASNSVAVILATLGGYYIMLIIGKIMVDTIVFLPKIAERLIEKGEGDK